jgi:hypothetical protein
MSGRLTLAIAALLWSHDAVAVDWVMPGQAPSVGIFLDFDHAPSASLIGAMQREVAAVLSATGVRFSWMRLASDKPSGTFDQLAVLRFHGSCRMEALGRPERSADGRPATLAATDLTSGSVSPYSSVLCDQIKTCIAGALSGSCARDRETAFGRALGRVVAHELYHILGKTTDHTREGISKALQNSADLIKEHFTFDRQALAWLRQRLQFSKSRAQNPSPERSSFAD